MNTHASVVLVEARKIIAQESTWTQGAMALNDKGEKTSAAYGPAVCFCSVGAIRKAEYQLYGCDFTRECVEARLTLARFMGGSMPGFND